MGKSYSVIIIGGGPAGTAAALHLIRHKPDWAEKILIIDKARFPRPKLCGGGLTPAADSLLEELGISLTIASHPIHEMDVIVHDRSFTPGGRLFFRVVSRKEFDHALFQTAQKKGVCVLEGEKVMQFFRQGDGVTVQTNSSSYHSQVVIGADGVQSVIRQTILGWDSGQIMPALATFLPRLNQKEAPSLHKATLDFRPLLEGVSGYYWKFPMAPQSNFHMNCGIVDMGFYKGRKTTSLREVLRKYLSGCEASIQGYPIRYFDESKPMSSYRTVLAGDALGTDRLWGEGITSALESGMFAAQAVLEALETNDFSFRDFDSRFRNSPLGLRLSERNRMARTFYERRGEWRGLLWDLLTTSNSKPIF